jgi:hypothetical protein
MESRQRGHLDITRQSRKLAASLGKAIDLYKSL